MLFVKAIGHIFGAHLYAAQEKSRYKGAASRYANAKVHRSL
jgi:hypothetical protein